MRKIFQLAMRFFILSFLVAGILHPVYAASARKVVEREGELECLIAREYDVTWKLLSSLIHESGQVTFENRLSGRLEADLFSGNAHLILRIEQISLDEGKLRIQAFSLRDGSPDLNAARLFYKSLKKNLKRV
ncbi:MAG: hypothetical protein H6757_01550 [Candidatus Omnitrophica bacterium]|nr:hypothetical protein [Candidatus Omnitrophota bacterium]